MTAAAQVREMERRVTISAQILQFDLRSMPWRII
jgi:hypothetical protein